jgi:hypothetical protein
MTSVSYAELRRERWAYSGNVCYLVSLHRVSFHDMIRLRAFAPLLALCGGCGLLDDAVDCTLVGGQSGLTVKFTNVASAIVRVQVKATGLSEEPAYVAECSLQHPCESGVFFPNYIADRAYITLVSTTGTVSGEAAPMYQVTYPNGKKCAGKYSRSTVVMDARNGQVSGG